MCVIVYKPANKTVSKKQLLNCWKANPEGAGFMWSDGNSLLIEKGFFRFRKLYRMFRRIERAYLKSSFVIHFRKASVGSISKENCHPFYFKNNKFGFAHNGTLLDWLETATSTVSDSINFTTKLLEKLPDDFSKNVGIRFLLGKYASHHNSKFIFMDYQGEVIISNKHQWEEEKGIMFSNNSYLGLRVVGKQNTMGFGVANWNDDTYDLTKEINKTPLDGHYRTGKWQPCPKCGTYFNVSLGKRFCWQCSKNLIVLRDFS